MQTSVEKASEDAAGAVKSDELDAPEDMEMELQGADTSDEAPATPGDPALVEGAAAAAAGGAAAGAPVEGTVAEAEFEVGGFIIHSVCGQGLLFV